jgi:hypothetical protein
MSNCAGFYYNSHIDPVFDDWVSLVACCSRGYVQLAKLLLDNGHSDNIRHILARCMLVSISNNHLEILKMLLECDKVDASMCIKVIHYTYSQFNTLKILLECEKVKNSGVRFWRLLAAAERGGYDDIVDLFNAYHAACFARVSG